ncbi:MAG TPA: DinB family protein [Gemmatimonadales bacterium]|jgi:hypothetical protein|nr:DinB family protein [Gemmatimonadales bacterium]
MTVVQETAKELDIFRRQAGAVNRTVKVNLAGITHEDSLIQPEPGGNCLNWVLGHLLSIYNQALPLLGQHPVLDQATITRYARGSDPISDNAEARRFEDLMSAWDETVKRIDAGLAALTPEALDRPAPQGSGPSEPGDKVLHTLSTLMFHQGYHAGQTGVLRRLVGKAGAIK